jgi:type IV pilus assembly protein PilQ
VKGLGLVLAAALLAAASTSAQTEELTSGEASVRAVRYHVEPGRTKVWLETSRPLLYTHYSPDPLTLVIDLPGVDISAIPERTAVGSREVESVVASRLAGSTGKTLSRIELRLGSLAPYQISSSEQALTILLQTAPATEVPAAAGASANGDSSSSVVATPELSRSGGPRAAPEGVPAVEKRTAPELTVPERRRPVSALHPATTLRKLEHGLSRGLLTVTLDSDGRLAYSSFRLHDPERLVFDFNGVLNRVASAKIPIGALGVSRARVAQYQLGNPNVTRLVFDLDTPTVHRAVEDGSRLRIHFAESSERLAQAVPLASMGESPPAPPPSAAWAGAPTAPVPTEAESAAAAPETLGEQSQPIVIQPLTSVEVEQETLPSLPSPDPAAEPRPGALQPPGLPTSFEARTIGAEEKVYTGELISLDFKDGDIQDIFRLFAEISGLNVVLQPGVSGRVTLRLNEVPWDQALELVLKTNKLGYIQEGNVIRIAPLAQLAEEEAERRKLAEEKALAGELNTLTQSLSYAKAKDAEPLLKRNLSPRGDIVVDERTNTLIVTDLPDYLQNVRSLIDTLDSPIPGVEIEARVVVTTRSFSRQLGIQWGFTGQMSQLYGNTTELVFPNNVQIFGQPIGGAVREEFKGPADFGGGLRPPQIGTQFAQRGYAVNLPFAESPTGAVGITLGSITGAFSVDAALSAAETRGDVRILSAPKIVTQNNKAAVIKQGVTFPIQVVANNTVTIQFKDAVLELNVTPQITSAETIILDLKVNNDSLDFSRQVQGVPTIVTQSATTQVLVSDGSTTVIGGVFVNRDQRDQRYVPLLHKIPILGYLFRSGGRSTRNEELLIFITPRIRKNLA